MTEKKKIRFKARTIWQDGRMIGVGDIEDEKWLPIPDYDNFTVSSWGNIKEYGNYSHIMYHVNTDGYRRLRCQLKNSEGRKCKPVAVYVNLAFNGEKPSDNHTTDHIDCDSTNNYYKNLKWSNPSEQARNKPCRKHRKYIGVYSHGRGWKVRIRNNGREETVGQFATEREGALAYNRYIIDRNIKDREPNLL